MTIVLVLLSALIRQWRLDQEQKVSASRSTQDAAKARLADQQVGRLSYFGLMLVWIVGGVVDLVGGTACAVYVE